MEDSTVAEYRSWRSRLAQALRRLSRAVGFSSLVSALAVIIASATMEKFLDRAIVSPLIPIGGIALTGIAICVVIAVLTGYWGRGK